MFKLIRTLKGEANPEPESALTLHVSISASHEDLCMEM